MPAPTPNIVRETVLVPGALPVVGDVPQVSITRNADAAFVLFSFAPPGAPTANDFDFICEGQFEVAGGALNGVWTPAPTLQPPNGAIQVSGTFRAGDPNASVLVPFGIYDSLGVAVGTQATPENVLISAISLTADQAESYLDVMGKFAGELLYPLNTSSVGIAVVDRIDVEAANMISVSMSFLSAIDNKPIGATLRVILIDAVSPQDPVSAGSFTMVCPTGTLNAGGTGAGNLGDVASVSPDANGDLVMEITHSGNAPVLLMILNDPVASTDAQRWIGPRGWPAQSPVAVVGPLPFA